MGDNGVTRPSGGSGWEENHSEDSLHVTVITTLCHCAINTHSGFTHIRTSLNIMEASWTHHCDSACQSTPWDTRTGRVPRNGLRSGTAGCRSLSLKRREEGNRGETFSHQCPLCWNPKTFHAVWKVKIMWPQRQIICAYYKVMRLKFQEGFVSCVKSNVMSIAVSWSSSLEFGLWLHFEFIHSRALVWGTATVCIELNATSRMLAKTLLT